MTQAIVLLRSWLIILIYSIYYRLECIYCTFAAWMCAETHRVLFRYTIWAFTVNNNDHFWYETVNFMFFAVVVVCSGVQLYCICVESQLEKDMEYEQTAAKCLTVLKRSLHRADRQTCTLPACGFFTERWKGKRRFLEMPVSILWRKFLAMVSTEILWLAPPYKTHQKGALIWRENGRFFEIPTFSKCASTVVIVRCYST